MVCCRSSLWSPSWLGAATAITEARWVRGPPCWSRSLWLTCQAELHPSHGGPWPQTGAGTTASLAVGRAGAPWRAPGGGPGRGGCARSPVLLPASAECRVLHHGDRGPQRGQVLTHQLAPETAPQERYSQPRRLKQCFSLERPLSPETQVAEAPGPELSFHQRTQAAGRHAASDVARALAVQGVSRVVAF